MNSNQDFDPDRPGNPFDNDDGTAFDGGKAKHFKPTSERSPTTNGMPAHESDHWPDPQPLDLDGCNPESFRASLLPSTVRAWVEDVTERMQVPMDYPGVAMMVVLAAAVGRKLGIRPKRFDDFTVVPNLWGMIVGRPGFMKSPALAEIMRPLRRLEAEAAEQYKSDKHEYEIRQKLIEANAADVKKRLKDASPDEAHAILSEHELTRPLWRRFIVNDATPEKLGEILSDNPQGILLFRDELSGWLATLRKAGYEGARKFFLEAWNGAGGYTQDRIGRGTIRINHVCLSILGSIQPDVLHSLLRDGLSGGASDDGMLQRFQLMVWPEPATEFENVDRRPNGRAKEQASETIRRLVTLDPQQVGAEPDDDDRREVRHLRFDPEAQALFDGWRTQLEHRIRSGKEHPAMESHLAKYRSLMPTLALLYHIADGGRGPVTYEAAIVAVAWIDYLESHGQRIYAPATRRHLIAAQSLASHLQAGHLPNEFTHRDVYRKGWSGLKNKEAVEEAVTVLIDHDWLWASEKLTKGRTTTVHLINPGICALQNTGLR